MTILEHDIRRAVRAGLLDGSRVRSRSQEDAMDLAEAIYTGNSIGSRECRKAYVFAYMNGGSK